MRGGAAALGAAIGLVAVITLDDIALDVAIGAAAAGTQYFNRRPVMMRARRERNNG
jgi:hypothetical protein